MLRDRALALYLDLLNMIEAMIASLVETSICELALPVTGSSSMPQRGLTLSIGKHIKDGLKDAHSDRPLDEKIKQSKQSMQALQDQLDYLRTSTLVATNETISRMDPRLDRVEETVNGSQRLAWDTHHRMEAMGSSIGDVGHGIECMRRDMTKQLEETIRVNRQLESSTEATKHIMTVLKGVLDFAECKTHVKRAMENTMLMMDQGSPII
jgi:phage-related tail protein